MTKQTQQSQQTETDYYNIANEEINEGLILRSWKGVLSQVQRVREWNKSQNIPESIIDNHIGYYYDGYTEPMDVKQKRRWLERSRWKKSQKWISVSSLVESGRISDIEQEMFGSRPYPRIEVSQMIRTSQ